uniref:Uncharacterized protein n=1 Tax=uncultured bacterium contig00195 TaxID=1181607 RepID=A0A806KDW0_9BACT|nr:hypothetical protein [uncultured bacterium contig00195]
MYFWLMIGFSAKTGDIAKIAAIAHSGILKSLIYIIYIIFWFF